MDIISEIRNKFIDSSLNIDDLISNYLMKRLGVKYIETINALSNDGKLTFKKRLDLLLQIKSHSTIEAAKIKVYTEVYDKFLESKYVSNYTEAYALMPSNDHFLTILYPQNDRTNKEEHFELVTNDLICDVERIITSLTKIHRILIIDDVDDVQTISIGRKFINGFLRKAML